MRFLVERLSEVSIGLIWIAFFSSLLFIDILPFDTTISFRIVNSVFYLGAFWTLYKASQLGWQQSIGVFFAPPLMYFNIFGLVCLISSFWSPELSDFPIDWSMQHAIRILIFFLSISMLAQRKQNIVLNMRVIYVLFTILLVRITLPIIEAVLSDSIMPWEWFRLHRDFYWYRWSLVSDWFNRGSWGKDDNALGLMVNSFGFILTIISLILINTMFKLKRNSLDLRFVLPIMICVFIVYQLGSQTAYLILVIGLVFILFSVIKWWSAIPVMLVGILALFFKDLVYNLFIPGWGLQAFISRDYRLNILFPAAIEGFLQRPWFGYGYASGEYLYFQNYGFPIHIIEAHNTILSIALNTGTIGLISFMFGILSMSWILLRFWVRSDFDLLSTNIVILLVSSCLASLLLTDVFYKFDDTLLIRMYPFFIILLLCQIIYNLNIPKKANDI